MCKTKILICAFLILRSALLQASNIQQASTPTGPAGGALTGTYPNPTLTGVTSLGAIAVGSSTTGVLSQVALGSAGALLYAGASGPAYTSTSGLVWDAANGRLGIGAASPAVALAATKANIGSVNPASTAWPFTIADSSNLGWRATDSAGNPKFELYIGFGSTNEMRLLGGVSLMGFNQDLILGAGNGAQSFSPFRIVNTSGSVGIGPDNTSPTGTLSVRDATPTTGSTLLTVRAGAGQSGNLASFQNSAGSEIAFVNSSGTIRTTLNLEVSNSVFFYTQDLLMYPTTATDTGNAYTFSDQTGSSLRQIKARSLNLGTGPTGMDLGLARNAAGVLEVNNGTPGTFRGLRASYVQSSGTTFTASGCSVSALTGGATAGRYTSGTTGACTVTVTMGNSATATNGWSCYASNRTTANLMRQTATTTTTATFDGTTVSGDVISFGCIGN